MNYSFLNNTISKIAFQSLLFGGVWMLIPLIFNDLEFGQYNFYRGLKILAGVTLIIGINIKWLLPKFYLKNKGVFYILAGITLLIIVAIVFDWLIDPYLKMMRPETQNRPKRTTAWNLIKEINHIMPFILAFVGSALIEISIFANRKMKEAMALQNEKLETEMKLLKSQINPHFLFNALNNIYSLSYLKPEKTPENLLKLSGMLRYMLYECNDKKVPLSKEIVYLENFVDLKLLKDSRGMKVVIDLQGHDSQLQIAPMLLIPFVENAFKHSHVEDLENGWIKIELTVKGSKINFQVVNSSPPKSYKKDSVGGIGLPNVKRQLSLIYPKKHQLNIQSDEAIYSVNLEIDLL